VKATAINGTLKPLPAESSCELLLSELLDRLREHGVDGEIVRAVEFLERLDAFLGEQDERGRMVSYDRVACVAVVGNEDGAHHVFAELAQGLSDEGFTIPAEGSVYWTGEAMQAVDFKDKRPTPEGTATATRTLARNAAHLARVLKIQPYPGD
jgi:hypothetical protein